MSPGFMPKKRFSFLIVFQKGEVFEENVQDWDNVEILKLYHEIKNFVKLIGMDRCEKCWLHRRMVPLLQAAKTGRSLNIFGRDNSPDSTDLRMMSVG